MSMKVEVEHNGVAYSGQIGTIESTSLGLEDHGIMTAWLSFKYDSGGIGVGGFCLDVPKDRDGGDYAREGTAYGLDHIIRLIETVGVSSWEKLKGAKAIVLFEGRHLWGSQSLGIAGLENGKVLILKDHADEWLAKS